MILESIPISEWVLPLCLHFGSESLLIPTVIIGFWIIDKSLFRHAITILLISILLNALLKQYFDIPSDDGLTMRYPSGHMQSACTFWGYLAFVYRNTLFRCVTLFLLYLHGLALVKLGYHYPIDIFASVIYSIATILAYQFLTKYYKKYHRQFPFVLLLLAVIGGLSLLFQYLPSPPPEKIWIAIGAIIGFFPWTWIESKYYNFKTYESVSANLAIAVFGLITAMALFLLANTLLSMSTASKHVHLIVQYAILGFWVSTLWPILIFPSRTTKKG